MNQDVYSIEGKPTSHLTGTEIILANVPWTYDTHLVDWSQNNLREYLLTLEDTYRFYSDHWLPVGEPLRVELPQYQAENYNYVYYRFTDSPKTHPGYVRKEYGHFITSHQMVNPNLTILNLSIDTWTTYFHDIRIKNGMHRRGHYPVEHASTIDNYLKNPKENTDYILDPDVNYTNTQQTREVYTQNFNENNTYMVFALPMNPEQLENLPLLNIPEKTELDELTFEDDIEYYRTNDFPAILVDKTDTSDYPDRTDSLRNDEYVKIYTTDTSKQDGGINLDVISSYIPENKRYGEKWKTNANVDFIPDYTKKYYNLDNLNGINIATSLHYYYTSYKTADELFEILAEKAPYFYLILQYVWQTDINLIEELTGTAIDVGGTGLTVKEIQQKTTITTDLDLSKLKTNNKTYTKLYTSPYTWLEISDNNTRSIQIKIEELTDNVKIVNEVSQAAPWISVISYLTGVGDNSTQSVTIRKLDPDTTETKTIYNSKYSHYMLAYDIPCYQVYLHYAKFNELLYAHTLRAQANKEIVNYHNSVRLANTNYENAREEWRLGRLSTTIGNYNSYLTQLKQTNTSYDDQALQLQTDYTNATTINAAQKTVADNSDNNNYTNRALEIQLAADNLDDKKQLTSDLSDRSTDYNDEGARHQKATLLREQTYADSAMGQQVEAQNNLMDKQLSLQNEYALMSNTTSTFGNVVTGALQNPNRVGKAIMGVNAAMAYIGTFIGIDTNGDLNNVAKEYNNAMATLSSTLNTDHRTHLEALIDDNNEYVKDIIEKELQNNLDYLDEIQEQNKTTHSTENSNDLNTNLTNNATTKTAQDTIAQNTYNAGNTILERDTARARELAHRQVDLSEIEAEWTYGTGNYETQEMRGDVTYKDVNYIGGGQVRNLKETQLTQIDMSQQTLEANLKLIEAQYNQAQWGNPYTAGAYSGNAQNDLHGRRTLTIREVSMQDTELARISQIFKRYGYMWEGSVGEITNYCINTQDPYTYWQFHEIILDRTRITERVKNTIQGFFIRGVTIWKTPQAIETTSYI